MIFDENLQAQLKQYLALLESDLEINYAVGDDEHSLTVLNMLKELNAISSRIILKETKLPRVPSFTVAKVGETARITFAGAPLGHEFTSLVLALLQVSGRAPKVEQATLNRVKNLKGKLDFTTYISLTCHNCPDVVQALNLFAVVNPLVTHTMVDGSVYQQEVEAKNIMGVPAIYLNDEFLGGGRHTIDEILDKLGAEEKLDALANKGLYDMLVIGGGPAGASAAVYGARKGIKVGLVAERFGGQVLDTVGVDNLIGTLHTEGSKIAQNLEAHCLEYNVDIIKKEKVAAIERHDVVHVILESGVTLKSKTVVLATGAKWRNTGAPGEIELQNKGVAYCPHCDGPLFKGKDVAVIGGGNSGIEAAIDLAGITKHVTVLEFMPDLKADQVLQDKLYSLPNVDVYKNVATTSINGTDRVESISFKHRETGEEKTVALQGIFVQIGLAPNTAFIGQSLERNRFGEIVIDQRGATSMEGVYAAGDCATTPYKQIIVAMGSGATAALSAFDYLVRTNK